MLPSNVIFENKKTFRLTETTRSRYHSACGNKPPAQQGI